MKHLLLSLTLLSSAVCTHSLTQGTDDHDILRSGGKNLSDKHSKCNDCATSGWCSFGRDLCNHRHGHNVTIDTDNVGQLQLAWTFSTTFNISAPVAAADGVLYFGEGRGPGGVTPWASFCLCYRCFHGHPNLESCTHWNYFLPNTSGGT